MTFEKTLGKEGRELDSQQLHQADWRDRYGAFIDADDEHLLLWRVPVPGHYFYSAPPFAGRFRVERMAFGRFYWSLFG